MTQNIYAPPESELVSNNNDQEIELAKRSSRLYAAIIDAMIGIAFAIPFIMFAGPILGFEFGQRTQPSIQYLIISSLYGFVVFALVQGYFLSKSGQTIGKKALGIKIVSTSYDKVSVFKILGLRYLPVSFASIIPIAGQFLPLLDVLFIFRNDRRCIHDLIAGTCVVKCNT